MYNRLLYTHIKKSSKSILLLGARQVGKSTLIKSLKPDLQINLANEEDHFDFLRDPAELTSRLEAGQHETVFIDEIQRIPRLLNTIQSILDGDSKIKFYLSGSSARKLRRGKANLLPGRLFTYQLAPLCLKEVGSDWNENKVLSYGSLPGVFSMKKDFERKKLLSSYAKTYLKEEIMAESLVRNLDGFVRFIHEASVTSGGFLDFSKIAKKSRIPRQSIVRHFEILEDTLIARKVSNDPDLDPEVCDLVKHPKYFLFDLGVVNALRGGFEVTQDRVGGLWEHLVFNQIINSSIAQDLEAELFNFRTRGGLEVDFVYSLNGKKTAIECKAAQAVHSSDYANLLAIERYYPRIQKILVYRGKHEKKENGVWIVPLKKALEVLGL